LLNRLQQSEDVLDLENAAKIALKLSENGKAGKLLERAVKAGISKGLPGNVIRCAEMLRELDETTAVQLFEQYVRKQISRRSDIWSLWSLAHDVQVWGNCSLATRLRKRALKDALKSDYLSAYEIHHVVRIMKELGMKDRAKLFANEYFAEIQNDKHTRLSPDTPRDYVETMAAIAVDAGVGASLLKEMMTLCKERLRFKLPLRNGPAVIESLCTLLKDEESARKLFKTLAGRYEREAEYYSAKHYYTKAGALDDRTKYRLAKKEISRIIKGLGTKTPDDYMEPYHTFELTYLKNKPPLVDSKEKRLPYDPHFMYSIGLSTDVRQLLEISKDLGEEQARKQVLRKAIRRLCKFKIYSEAARIAEEIGESEHGKRLWRLASLDFEKKVGTDPQHENGTLRGAIACAKWGDDPVRHIALLAQYIEKLVSNPPVVFSYEDVAEYVSRDFLSSHESLCQRLMTYLVEKKYYLQAARLKMKLGISDKKVFEEALVQLEESGRFSEAAGIANVLGDEDISKVYSFISDHS